MYLCGKHCLKACKLFCGKVTGKTANMGLREWWGRTKANIACFQRTFSSIQSFFQIQPPRMEFRWTQYCNAHVFSSNVFSVPLAFRMCLVSRPRITIKLFLSIYVLQGGKKLVHVFSTCQNELWRNLVNALDLSALLCFCNVSELLRYIAMASKLDAPISNVDPMGSCGGGWHSCYKWTIFKFWTYIHCLHFNALLWANVINYAFSWELQKQRLWFEQFSILVTRY